MSTPQPLPDSLTLSSAATSSFVLNRRRVYILPTRQGLAFCAVALVMLIGAINYNNSLGYLLTFLLASLAMVSMLHAYRNLAGLGLRLLPGESTFAGEPTLFMLTVDNRGQLRRPDVCASFKELSDSRGTEKRVAHFAVEADTLSHVELRPKTSTRGWFALERVTLSTRYPLGLFRAWSNLDSTSRVAVYPKPAGVRELPASAESNALQDGSSGQGNDDFAGLKSYVPGDSTRRIHWKAVARGQDISVKLFSGGTPTEMALNWNDTAGDNVETRLSQLCIWVCEAASLKLSYRLELPDATVGPGTGEVHRHECLRALALFGTGDDGR